MEKGTTVLTIIEGKKLRRIRRSNAVYLRSRLPGPGQLLDLRSHLIHAVVVQNIEVSHSRGLPNIRPLTECERQAMPYFEIVAVIWVMAIYIYNADRVGNKLFLETPFWDRRLARVQALAQRLPG